MSNPKKDSYYKKQNALTPQKQLTGIDEDGKQVIMNRRQSRRFQKLLVNIPNKFTPQKTSQFQKPVGLLGIPRLASIDDAEDIGLEISSRFKNEMGLLNLKKVVSTIPRVEDLLSELKESENTNSK